MKRTTRPRGFAPWNPRYETLLLIEQVKNVLVDYEDILPLTLRQVFYVLVSKELIDKTEKSYKSLGEMLNRARRSGMIDFDSIRDDGFRVEAPYCFDDLEDLYSRFTATAEAFRLDRQLGQDRRLFVWCEAAGMVPQLTASAEGYGIQVNSSGGFDSVTSKHSIAQSFMASFSNPNITTGNYYET